MTEMSDAVQAVIAYLQDDAAGDAKGKWAKGYRQACVDHIAVLRLVLASEEDDA